jgi:chromosome segregation ATPase
MRSNVKIMKTKNLLGLALFITITALLSGCAKTDAGLQAENADLKARVQQLEQQLQQLHASNSEMASSASSHSAISQDLQGQLADAQKKVDAATDESKSLSSQVDALKQKVDELTRQLADAQQAKENAEKALQLYQDKATSALKQFQALRSTLSAPATGFDRYHQNYLATQSAVADVFGSLPESQVRRQIVVVLAQFKHVDDIWQTADREMQARTREAQADYDQLMDFGGLGPNRYTVELGKDRILAPVAQDNAATALRRNRQMVSQEKNLDAEINNFQALLNGQPA